MIRMRFREHWAWLAVMASSTVAAMLYRDWPGHTSVLRITLTVAVIRLVCALYEIRDLRKALEEPQPSAPNDWHSLGIEARCETCQKYRMVNLQGVCSDCH
jgi:hypothetical protein